MDGWPSQAATPGARCRGQTPYSSHESCPNCEWTHLGIFDQSVVDRFDEELDRGTECLIEDLTRLTHANMEDEIERFSSALSSDAIWPMDF